MSDTGKADAAETSSKKIKAAARAARLKEQLRQNLHKRKGQSRARGTGKQSSATEGEG